MKWKYLAYGLNNTFFLIDEGWEWYVCEGFQLVLKQQAEALEALGVCPQMKVCRDRWWNLPTVSCARCECAAEVLLKDTVIFQVNQIPLFQKNIERM